MNSTTEEDTEEEVPAIPANKKTKRRRRNFSSSTSSSYSSSLATNSTIHSSNVTPANISKKAAGEGSSTVKDLIAYRTRSRTQSVERSVELDTSTKSVSAGQKRKTSRASRSQLLSDSEIDDDSQEEQADNEQSVDKSDKNTSSKKTIVKSARTSRGAGGSSSRKVTDKSNNNSKKSLDNFANSSVNSDRNQATSSRTLRSRTQPSSTTGALSSVIPKKRQRYQSSTSGSGLTNPESTGSGSKAPNLGARLARNQGGQEPHNTAAQQPQTQDTASTQQQTGHPPQNLLRRSSRKGASSSSTTGSCVSGQFNYQFNHAYDCETFFISSGLIISFH